MVKYYTALHCNELYCIVLGEEAGNWHMVTKTTLNSVELKFRSESPCPFAKLSLLLNTRRYGQLRRSTSSSCGALWTSAEAFFALLANKGLFMLFRPVLGRFWCSVVPLVIFSGNLSYFEREKNPKK